MTKDAEKLLKYIVDESKNQNNVEVEINISAIKNIPNILYSKNKLLNELEAAGVICGYKENILGEIFVYLTTDGLEYFDNLNRDVNLSSIVFNVSGGQVNIANDYAKIEANVDPYWSNNEKSVTAENKIDKETNSSFDTQNGKVFISYSWTPESNKKWVEKLAHRLEEDGVQVVIDFKDLKFGHDKFAFMERTVNDETIKKVLIICNRTYKEKADDRIGGVGDESAIITSQVYGNVRQEKFIPVVNEYDENGNPYLPNYLASRMYADLTDFEKGYEQLLCNIVEVKNSIQRMYMSDGQDIGTFLNREETEFFETPNLKIVQNLWTQTPEIKLSNESHIILKNFYQSGFIMSIPSKVYFQNKHSNDVHSLLTLSPISYEVIVEQINTGNTTGDISVSKLPPSFKGKMGERDVIRGGIVEETEDMVIWIDTYPFLVIVCDVMYDYGNKACRETIINTPMGSEYIEEIVFEYIREYFRDNAKYEVQLLSADQNIYYKANEMVKKLFGDCKNHQTFFCGKEGGYGGVLKLINQIITPNDILK